MSEKGRNANRLGPGRPCLDEERQKNICAIIAQGMSLQSAADFEGVDNKTIYRHTKRDPKFAEAMRKARSRGESRLILKVREAADEKKYWRAATWLLANCYRDKYYVRRQGIPVEQVRMVFDKMIALFMSEVRSADDRKRIMARLRNLNGTLTGALRANLLLGFEA